MQREMARDAGLSMDEFRELEGRTKKMQDAEKSGLKEFRESGEQNIYTQAQEDALKPKEHARRDHADGTPEVDLLDSVKHNIGRNDDIDEVVKRHEET